jgi:hypothetical protein
VGVELTARVESDVVHPHLHSAAWTRKAHVVPQLLQEAPQLAKLLLSSGV